MIVELLERDEEKKQVVLCINGEVTPMDIESFDRHFKEIEPGKYEAGKDFVDMINHKLDDIQDIIPHLMIASNNNSPAVQRRLGEKITQYARKWNIDEKTASLEIASVFERYVSAMTKKMSSEVKEENKG